MELPPRYIEVGGIKQRNPEYDDALKLVTTHLCEVCGSILIEAYDGGKEIIRCGADKTHNGITRGTVERAIRERLERMGASQAEIEEHISDYKRRREKKTMVEQLGETKTTELEKYVGVTSLTKKEATDIIVTVWNDAPAKEVAKAAILCAQYGLNPLMQHLFLMPFWDKKKQENKWVTVLGINATRLMAQRAMKDRGGYSYITDTPRIMTAEEQVRFFGEEYTDRIYALCVIMDGQGNTYRGFGFWLKKDEPYGADKGNTRHNMAFIRAERDALKKAAPAEMPSLTFDVVDEGYMPRTGKIEATTVGATDTVEGEVKDLGPASPTPSSAATTSPAAPAAEAPKEKSPEPKKTATAAKKAAVKTNGVRMSIEEQHNAIKSLLDIRFNTSESDASVHNKWTALYGTGDPAKFTYDQAGQEIERLQRVQKPGE